MTVRSNACTTSSLLPNYRFPYYKTVNRSATWTRTGNKINTYLIPRRIRVVSTVCFGRHRTGSLLPFSSLCTISSARPAQRSPLPLAPSPSHAGVAFASRQEATASRASRVEAQQELSKPEEAEDGGDCQDQAVNRAADVGRASSTADEKPVAAGEGLPVGRAAGGKGCRWVLQSNTAHRTSQVAAVAHQLVRQLSQKPGCRGECAA